MKPNRSLVFTAVLLLAVSARSEVNKVENVAPDVYFHEGDISFGHCNNGWIVFEDFVLVVDANFPSGAQIIVPKIKEITDKPVKFAFDTHHHGDHAYANQFWVEQGATPVAHTGVLEEMKRLEPDRWNSTAKQKNRKDVAASKLKHPTVLFEKDLFFDDGKHRVELLHFGTAHTKGDGFAWLPKERILFTGDACVNGAFNFVGDGNITEWIRTLDKVKQLNPKVVCPGHGPKGGPELLEDQQKFFIELRDEVKKLMTAGKKQEDMKAASEQIATILRKNERIARYVGGAIGAQAEKIFTELSK